MTDDSTGIDEEQISMVVERLAERVESAAASLFDVTAEAVFLTERHDERLIITAGAVQRAGGFGFGGGSGRE